MRSRKSFVLFAITCFWAGLLVQACDGDDDTDACTECWCDPDYCDGGDADGSADADADADGDVRPDGDADSDADSDADADSDSDTPTVTATLHVETWMLSSDGTPRDLPGADATADGQHCTTPCDLELPVGDRNLYLSLAGWVQGPNPLPLNLSTDSVVVNEISTSIVEVSGLTVRHRLEKDTTGRWRRESDGYPQNVDMEHVWPPDLAACPDSLVTTGFDPLGAICVEGETLTLCKTHASECEGMWAEGRVIDGRRVEFTFFDPTVGVPENYAYTLL